MSSQGRVAAHTISRYVQMGSLALQGGAADAQEPRPRIRWMYRSDLVLREIKGVVHKDWVRFSCPSLAKFAFHINGNRVVFDRPELWSFSRRARRRPCPTSAGGLKALRAGRPSVCLGNVASRARCESWQ